ncbi:uncharacterized protein LOC119580848 [Penaeus monodon]|uniref:uncharacterized protein LOC119580848 n=1 Tax=Penaeus monodon TaxID=6687 RepID=UPI0018A78F57|nr:uncharacterized protein LOC119580848 [Penaeus monodon]
MLRQYFLVLQVFFVFSLVAVFYLKKLDVTVMGLKPRRQAEKTPEFLSDDVTTKGRPSPAAPPSTTQSPPSSADDPAFRSCACSLSVMSKAGVYDEQLETVVPWANLTTRQALEKQHPNFPLNLVRSFDKKWCHLLPMPHLINWNNIYLQSVKVSNTTFLVYSAFFDNRELTDLRPCIRIVAYAQTKFPDVPWCYIWFNSTGPPVVSRVARTEFLDCNRDLRRGR